MRKSILAIAILCAGWSVTSSARAETEAALSPILKLGNFASACSAPQVRALLARDTTFDINAYPVTLTPVQLAMKRLLRAAVENDADYQTACLATITAIMRDTRYVWQEIGARQNTDLIYFLRNTDGVEGNDQALKAYRIALFSVLGTLSKKDDFDINYQIQAPTGPREPATAAGAAAAGGLPRIWCDLAGEMPAIDLEGRKGERFFTPLLIAVSRKKTDMVRRLVGQGADYLVHVDGVAATAAETIAVEVGATDIRTFFINHRQANALGTACDGRASQTNPAAESQSTLTK